MKSRFATILALLAMLAMVRVASAPHAFAEPYAQATPVPTEEPTKAPYVFPTPIFIPTYADDTPVPRATLAPGQLVGASSYTVQSGDSLWVIAQKVYGDGSKYPLIAAANNITSATRLRVGTVLIIPSLAGGASPTATTATTAPAAPTPAPPTLAPVPAPILSPTPRASPAPASWTPASLRDAVELGVNIVSALLLLAALAAALMAYLIYLRARRLERLASGKQPLRITQ